MDIFLRVLKNFNESVKKNKTDKQKFPQNILGDFIIMNINHPKDDVRDITKDVMIKFIDIFGNKIFTKMQMIIDDKELSKIFQDKKELKITYENIKNEKNNEVKPANIFDGVFLTNVNKKFQIKNNNYKNKLTPIGKNINGKIKFNSNNNKIKNLIHSSSQPKLGIIKSKLKPINVKRNKIKILTGSKSQNFEEIKK